MATLTGAEPTASQGSDEEEDTVWEPPYYGTPERRHVEALLDISEEVVLRELEPHESHCYSDWEQAVRGWARAAPLSCIFLSHEGYKKAKQKKVGSPALHDAERSAGIAEHHCESHTGSSNSWKGKRATLLNQQTACWSHTAVAALQAGASEWTVLSAMQQSPSHSLLEEELEEEKTPSRPHQLSPKHSASENRPTKPQSHSHRPSRRLVPIKNFTFLPPIESPHLNPRLGGQLFSGKKASHGEVLHNNAFMFDKKSETRGTKWAPDANTHFPSDSAALLSKHHTCQHNLNRFSALSVPLPNRYQVPLSSNPDTVHYSSYLVARSLTPALHSTGAIGAQYHLHPSCLFS